MKKVSRLFASLFIILLLTVNVFAAGVSCQLNKEAVGGEELTVKIILSGNSGISDLNLAVHFDSEAVSFVNVTNGLMFSRTSYYAQNDQIRLTYYSSENVTSDGVLASINFLPVSKERPDVNIIVEVISATDSSGEKVTVNGCTFPVSVYWQIDEEIIGVMDDDVDLDDHEVIPDDILLEVHDTDVSETTTAATEKTKPTTVTTKATTKASSTTKATTTTPATTTTVSETTTTLETTTSPEPTTTPEPSVETQPTTTLEEPTRPEQTSSQPSQSSETEATLTESLETAGTIESDNKKNEPAVSDSNTINRDSKKLIAAALLSVVIAACAVLSLEIIRRSDRY